MKQMVQRNLTKIIIICMLVTLAANYLLQIKLAQRDMGASSKMIFGQIDQILSENKIETEKVKKEFEETCLVKAKAAAYIVQNHPAVLEDQNELKKIAELLQIDEFHIFNTDGVIYAGSEPKYFGYHFHSGPQMEFFLPMMEDKTLEMCQPITPNTAEGKLMQYAAVWRDDGEGIVQIGMEPERVLEATKKNELSYIFSLLTEGTDAHLYAADPDTYEILGSTDRASVGKTLFDIGINRHDIDLDEESFHATVNGVLSYCDFVEQNQILVGRICTAKSLYGEVNESTLLVALYLFAISAIMILSISRYLDRNIIRGINAVNYKLQTIADGDLYGKVAVHTTTEFTELSEYINHMVKSLLHTTDKISSVLNMVQIPIGIYEYNPGIGRVQTIGKIPEILELSGDDTDRFLADCKLFEEKLAAIRNCPADKNNTVFHLPENAERYIKMDSYVMEDSIFGIIMDVTEDVNEKKLIKQQRDEDVLTGLYNRRAFYAQIESLFEQPDVLKHAAFISIDTDYLKKVNDTYGHEAGDHYLCGMADILRSCTAPQKITARLSGDEFEVFIYGCESDEELKSYIRELTEKQNGTVFVYPKDGLQVPVHFSIGSAFYPEDGKEHIRLLKYADDRMYEDKRLKHKQRGC